MVIKIGLPARPEDHEGWGDGAPDPLALPEYYAGVVLKRVLAYLIDVAIIAVLSGLAGLTLFTVNVVSFGTLGALVWPALALIPLAYHTLLIGGARSATFGMRLLGIEVRTWRGRRPEYVQAALQTIIFYVSVAMTSWLILVIALFNAHRRTLHDYLCGTLIINSLPWPPGSDRVD